MRQRRLVLRQRPRLVTPPLTWPRQQQQQQQQLKQQQLKQQQRQLPAPQPRAAGAASPPQR